VGSTTRVFDMQGISKGKGAIHAEIIDPQGNVGRLNPVSSNIFLKL
jgi:hypothetical protein